ncbi:MAG: class I SAM-dependent RNA methyltransferase [Hyphomicrobium aestuarii]|nr:class I SAM-dependent RNA methyltransferase [Hyphomicrobium aestuarii]
MADGDRNAAERLTIDRLGHEGDGIAATADGSPVFVPYAAPGDVVRATVHGTQGTIVEIIAPSDTRTAAICRHFGTCGGCAMQHIKPATYTAWKTAVVSGALAQHGLTPAIAPMVTAPIGSRRRAVLGAKRGPHGIIVGFHERREHRIFDVHECPVLRPALVEKLPALRDLADVLLPRFPGRSEAKTGDGLRFIATETDNGIDVVVEGGGTAPEPEIREKIALIARNAQLLRVSLDRDPLYVAAEPTIRFGTADIAPPPGVFLQAVPEIERAMAACIGDALTIRRGKFKPAVKRVADLYCGVGTFTFPMAAIAEVLAVDSDKRAIAALEAAYRRAQGLKPVSTLARDLFRDPLSTRELDAFDAIVFDPPRAGAAAQAERIAKSKARTVIAVSCAPGTLARDLATLTAGGYTIESVTPFDQFLFTPHVEVVAILRRLA